MGTPHPWPSPSHMRKPELQGEQAKHSHTCTICRAFNDRQLGTDGQPRSIKDDGKDHLEGHKGQDDAENPQPNCGPEVAYLLGGSPIPVA